MKKSKKSKPFGIVHREICEDERLSSSAVRLYSYLASFADNKTGRCFPTVDRLEEGLHMSRETLFIAKKALVDTGYIVVEKSQRVGGRFGNNVYYLPLLAKPKSAKPCTDNPHMVKGVKTDSTSTEKPNAEKPNAEKPNAENPHTNRPLSTDHILTDHNKQTSFYDLGGKAAPGETSDDDYRRQTEQEFEELREQRLRMLSRGK